MGVHREFGKCDEIEDLKREPNEERKKGQKKISDKKKQVRKGRSRMT
jgi:hypothetical protein